VTVADSTPPDGVEEEEKPPFKSRGILRTSTKIQLGLFVAITLLGVSYVSAEYVGLAKGLFGGDACTVTAEFPDSGGIFSNAEVTYRGVTVGRVGSLHLATHGVRVDLNIDDCSGSKIPASAAARVTDRSVVGEQYVDLLPPNDKPPYLKNHGVIPMSRNTIPTATQTLLVNLDRLVKSVNTQDLQTAIGELGKAFNDRGQDLASLLSSTNALVNAARDNLPATVALIDQSTTVLQTQLDEASSLRGFVSNLDLLSQALKSSDGDIRHLLDTAPTSLSELGKFITDNQTDLGVTLANLADVGQLLVRHRDGVEQILELYPLLAGGGYTGFSQQMGHLGEVVNYIAPQDCGDPIKSGEGYGSTVTHEPAVVTPLVPNVAAHCTAPPSSGTNVRGSANVPGGDPISASGGGIAYPRVDTNNVQIGSQLQDYGSGASEPYWQVLLTDSLH